MMLRMGSNGPDVVDLQEALGIAADGTFDATTEAAVKEFQARKGLTADGIVGPRTWGALGLASTDASERISHTADGLAIARHSLPAGQYFEGPTKKEYLFLHHTAGRNNPFSTVDSWANDDRGRIATQFVIGGPKPDTGETGYDGVVVECFDDAGYAWHLGRNGSQQMHETSVGIEVCNFGWLKKSADGYRTYADTVVENDQVLDLGYEFRGERYWHRYSDEQIEALRKLILEVARRHDIDVHKGLVERLRTMHPAEAFDWNEDAFNGVIKGMWTHTNTRRDKSDLSPQPDLVTMLLSL